ncbi:MAG: hypothetical protein ACTIJY_02780 [Luteimonas sp.]
MARFIEADPIAIHSLGTRLLISEAANGMARGARGMSACPRIEDGHSCPPWPVIHGVMDARVDERESNKSVAPDASRQRAR